MFDMLKNLLGSFRYRFWIKRLPKHSRKPKKNKTLKNPIKDNIETVKRCFAAYERFVMLGVVALGLLQLIALKFEQSVWRNFSGFLRSRSRTLPSERTVKFVVEDLLIKDLINLAPGAIMREIRMRCFKHKPVFQRTDTSPELENAIFVVEETV